MLNRTFVLALLLNFAVLPYACANLLVYPTRLDLTPDVRTKVLTVTNTSQKVNTYSLHWSEKTSLAEGGYRSLDQTESFPRASQFLRFSPRQVTLQPGERQTIKIALRRARNLADGEYRSHVLFRSEPNKAAGTQAKSTGTQITMAIGFAIPIAIRVGEYDASVAIQAAQVVIDPGKRTGQVIVNTERSGKHSTWGDMSAFWTPVGGKEVLIAKSANLNLWHELNNYTVGLSWAAKSFKPEKGTLRIIYEGVKQFSGQKFAEYSKELSIKDIEVLDNSQP